MPFKVGDKVKWRPQVGAFSPSGQLGKDKMGEVVEVVEPGKRPSHAMKGNVRMHVSYIVKVNGKPGEEPKYFWPVVGFLNHA